MTSSCAIYLGGSGIGLKHNPFGKDIANLALYRALARYAPGIDLTFLGFNQMNNDDVSALLYEGRPASKSIITTSVFNSQAIKAAGTLFRPTADLSDLAWMRRGFGNDREYSISGLIHSLAPPAMRDYIARAITSPIQPWDSMICTSPAVRDALIEMYERQADFLASRFGSGGRVPRPFPEMPVIPLGLEVDEIHDRLSKPGTRERARTKIGAKEGEIVVLWLGRLSFFEKAHPSPMFLAVEEAARRASIKVRFVNVGWFPGGEQHRELYEEAARIHAPSVTIEFFDGNDRDLVRTVWAGADIFISLVDNIQETFGITPIEAMAAGLPLVLSDWDGYRANARHGIEAFLIPTLLPPAGSGWLLSQRHVLGLDSYQGYAGSVALHTAVDVRAATEALHALMINPELRSKLGEAGLARAKSTYDWPIIIDRIVTHWSEQAQRRGVMDSHDANPEEFRVNPSKGEPFADFSGFATHVLKSDTVLRWHAEGAETRLKDIAKVRMNNVMHQWRADVLENVTLILAEASELPFAILAERMPKINNNNLALLIVWMAKFGLLSWRNPDAD